MLSLRLFKCLAFVLCFSFSSLNGFAASIDELLLRHQEALPLKLSYTETRYITFFDQPVLTNGMVYMTTQDFILLQNKPSRLLAASNHKRIWIYDELSQRRGSRSASGIKRHDPALYVLTQAFKSGNAKGLQQQFHIVQKQQEGKWLLFLEPKTAQAKKKYVRFVLKGPQGEVASDIQIEFTNGNKTTWVFNKLTDDKHLADEIKRLFKEARG